MISRELMQDGLSEVFSECGEVTDVTVIDGKGFGFIEFSDDASADKAIETLNGVEVDGREIRVDVANPRPERGGGGGYRGGGGGDRGGGDRW